MILAGGAGSRLGTEKALLKFDDRPLICWTVEKLQKAADEVIVVARDANQASVLQKLLPDVVFTCDSVPGFGPVAGLLSGMKCARGRLAFATGCDLPFLKVEAIEMLFRLAEGYNAAVHIRPTGLKEPLHSVYDREKMLFACEEAVKKGERRIQAPLKRLKVNYVPVDMLRSIDPMLLIFYNINTHEDLAEAQRLWTGHKL